LTTDENAQGATALKQQPVIMPDEPSVQGLHSSEVGHLDNRFGQFTSP
jgi:hypothetical protein